MAVSQASDQKEAEDMMLLLLLLPLGEFQRGAAQAVAAMPQRCGSGEGNRI